MIFLNVIDRKFKELIQEIKSLKEKELYHRMRKNFDQVPDEIKKVVWIFLISFLIGEL